MMNKSIWNNSTMISKNKLDLSEIKVDSSEQSLQIVDSIFNGSIPEIKDIIVLPKKFNYSPQKQIGFLKDCSDSKDIILEIVLIVKGSNFIYYPIILDFEIKGNQYSINNIESLNQRDFSIRIKKGIENLNGMFMQVLHDSFHLPNVETTHAIKHYLARMIPVSQDDYKLLDETYQERNNTEFLNKFNQYYKKIKYSEQMNMEYFSYFD